MKILFLDIDGVCNCQTTPNTDAWPIDPYMAFLVARIVEATDCKVVLSSSWRHAPEGVEIVSKRVVKLIGTTTLNADADAGAVRRYGTISRGTEILMWLEEHPEVTRYAILDDNADMHAIQKPHFFKTSWLTGLTQEITDEVIAHLNAK